jgi:hypothetical protein
VAAQGDGENGTSFDAASRGSDGLSWADGVLPQARSNFAETILPLRDLDRCELSPFNRNCED